MATLFLSSCGDATGGLHDWSLTNGTVSIASGAGYEGGSAILLDRTASDVTAYVRWTLTQPNSLRLSYWFRYGQAPSSNSTLARLIPAGSATVHLRPDNTIGYSSGGTGSVAVSPNTWVRFVCVATFDSGTTGNFTVTTWVNGTKITSTGTTTGTISYLEIIAPPGVSNTLTFDHVYLDDSASTDDPGDIRVTAHKPNALHVNTFGTIVGTGATRWARVSDIPVSTANGYTTNGTAQQETYGIEAAPAGATILAAKGWAWGQRVSGGGSPTYALFFDGTSYAATASTSPTFYSRVIDTATLPANVGFIKTAGSTNVNLWDTGVELAYQPGGPVVPEDKPTSGTSAATFSAAGALRILVATAGSAAMTFGTAGGGSSTIAAPASGTAQTTFATSGAAASLARAGGSSSATFATTATAAATAATSGTSPLAFTVNATAASIAGTSGLSSFAFAASAEGNLLVAAPVGPSSFLAFWIGGAGSAEVVAVDQPTAGVSTLTFAASGSTASLARANAASSVTFTAAGQASSLATTTGGTGLTFTATGNAASRASTSGTSSATFATAASTSSRASTSGAASATFAAAGQSASRATTSGTATVAFAANGYTAADVAVGTSGSASATFAATATGASRVAASGVSSATFATAGTGASRVARSGTSSLTFGTVATATALAPRSGTSSVTFGSVASAAALIPTSGTSSLAFASVASAHALAGTSGTVAVTFDAFAESDFTIVDDALVTSVFASRIFASRSFQ